MKIQILGTGLLLKRNKLAFCRCYYTLVELITVTAILTIVLAIGTVRIGAEIFDGGPEQKAEELRRIAAICRRQAAATGKECAVEFDPVERNARAEKWRRASRTRFCFTFFSGWKCLCGSFSIRVRWGSVHITGLSSDRKHGNQ